MVRRLLIVVGGLLVAAVVGVSYMGVAQVPLLSAAFGMDRARDLGMIPDQAALGDFMTKWGISFGSPAGSYAFDVKHQGTGSVQVDDTISEAALAALPEYHDSNRYFDDLQFRIHAGYAEISAFVHVPGYPVTGPVYGRASITRTSSTTVAVDISDLQFGRVGVPGDIVGQVKDQLGLTLDKQILVNGVSIETLQLVEGGIRFKGTWPQTITVP